MVLGHRPKGMVGVCMGCTPRQTDLGQPREFALDSGVWIGCDRWVERARAERKAFTHAQDYHWRKDLSVVVDALISRRAIISHGHM